jgi:hypothetical protein
MQGKSAGGNEPLPEHVVAAGDRFHGADVDLALGYEELEHPVLDQGRRRCDRLAHLGNPDPRRLLLFLAESNGHGIMGAAVR